MSVVNKVILIGSQRKTGQFYIIVQVPDLRILSQITNQNHFVYTSHNSSFLSFTKINAV
jgi:hypothetical protein